MESASALRQLLCERACPGEWTLTPVLSLEQVGRCVDLQVESALNRAAAPTPERYAESLGRALDGAADVLVTIDISGRTVGLLWVVILVEDDATTSAHVNSLVVTASMRGRGIGGQVMAWLERGAREAGLDAISLNYMDDNERVAPFYARLGFRRAGRDLERRLAPPELASNGGPPIGLGSVTISLRRSRAGDPIAVFDSIDVSADLASSEVLRAIVSDGERRAAAAGAEMAYATVWHGDGPLAEAMISMGWRVGRHKMIKRLRARRAPADRVGVTH